MKIRTDFSPANQFAVPTETVRWMSQPCYQLFLSHLLEKALPEVPDQVTLHFVDEPEVHWRLDKAFLSNHGKLIPLDLDEESQSYLRYYYETWRKPDELPADGIPPAEDVVAAGVVRALDSILSSKGREYDTTLVGDALQVLTKTPTEAGVADALRQLCLKKTEKTLPVWRVEASMADLLKIAGRQTDEIARLTEMIGRQAEEIAALRKELGRKRQGGRRTEHMKRQFAAFSEFMAKSSQSYGGTPPYAAAVRFWNRNKAKNDKAAKATGENKGYSSPKPLADAYHKSKAGRPAG